MRLACAALSLMAPDAKVSFDPNIRAEWLGRGDLLRQWQPVLERADYILPSAGEAALMTGAVDDETGCRQLAAAGKVVVLKQGAGGCTVYAGEAAHRIAGFDVAEIDPTGAGDTFCAGFTAAVLEGLDLADAAAFANAVGALAVTQKGPMEGAPTRAEVLALMAGAAQR